jgi:hypothetical protein
MTTTTLSHTICRVCDVVKEVVVKVGGGFNNFFVTLSTAHAARELSDSGFYGEAGELILRQTRK